MAEAAHIDTSGSSILRGPILHILVIGFHHKRGGQVDFSYPPLIEGQCSNSSDIPSEWKHLPFLALPDGAHNYLEDTIYFHLPGKDEKRDTVYGVSCYRQIDTKDLLSKDKEFTRGTVQKSVCILSTLPLYGLIQAKLKLITHAYFIERDFSKTSVLVELYNSLNGSLTTGQLDDSQAFLDLSLRDLILTFKHKVLVLFKLLLLERRVLFFAQPVHTLCTSLLSLVSLFPAMVEHGLIEAASYKHYRPPTPSLELNDFGIDTKEYEDVKMSHVPNYRKKKQKSSDTKEKTTSDNIGSSSTSLFSSTQESSSNQENSNHSEATGSCSFDSTLTRDSALPESIASSFSVDNGNSLFSNQHHDVSAEHCQEMNPLGETESLKREQSVSSKPDVEEGNQTPVSAKSLEEDLLALIDQELYGPYFEGRKLSEGDSETDSRIKPKESGTSPKESKSDINSISDPKQHSCAISQEPPPEVVLRKHTDYVEHVDTNEGDSVKHKTEQTLPLQEEGIQRLSGADDFVVLQNNCPSMSTLKADDFGFPLSLFGKGSLCHPYMSLQQHDLLKDVNVRCFLIGASNMLFKQRRHLLDVLVEVEEGKVIVFDPELRKQLSLSTADLRFVDFLIKNVSDKSEDVYLNNTGWEGGDEWIRAQFKVYLLSLLATALHQRHEKDMSDFNDHFVSAWKTTHNYRIWMSEQHPGIDYVLASHPCQGQLSVQDMKIRLQSAMQTTERGKKINSALNRTSVAMLHTGKAVGGALSSAKSAVSAWISGFAGEWKDDTNEHGNNK
ncbi:late secretory pathway protein AVL9 homolog [Acanthaster planci]|uniref:Late secretory pathway protein AVL9 homolog n=1 Tax=Acanthaster planci TaxID=133434 RepID=A0A8B7Z6Q9_ACAPL|nr:late secretory pathway protein AVL9 homolog [Acanthaster planci]XP_022099016.1 late secretory pathway protein AVL9 homolog [Acanthaster planci]XP_022099017.1 late secretory pathway protein AVL9 homolog [Acanthaster planci]